MIEGLAQYLDPSKRNRKQGDKVRITALVTGHNYRIGEEYYIYYTPETCGRYNQYILSSQKDNSGLCGSYITDSEFVLVNSDNVVDKVEFIKELENIIEFSKDFDFNENKDFASSYKVFSIFKEIKSSSSDSDKLKTIAKYIK